MAMNVIGLIGWIATWFGLLYVLIVYLSQGFVFLFVLPLCYCVYRVLVQLRYFPTAFRMVRVLRTYPWQVLPGVPRGLDEHPEAEDAGIWVEIPNPTGHAKGVPLVFVKHHRAYWWMRRIGGPRTKPLLKAQLEPLWFAGDPRFLGVLAASAKGGDAPGDCTSSISPPPCPRPFLVGSGRTPVRPTLSAPAMRGPWSSAPSRGAASTVCRRRTGS